jgi:hypothetical protein
MEGDAKRWEINFQRKGKDQQKDKCLIIQHQKQGNLNKHLRRTDYPKS